MTETLQLPQRLDDTLDIESLVERVEAGEVVLDWAQVAEVDHDAGRRLLAPFENRWDEFGDGLGIWSMPEIIEPDINRILEGGPEPEPEPTAWLFLEDPDSEYADEQGIRYEYPVSIPNGRRVAAGDRVVCALPSQAATDGKRIFGIGRIGEIQEAGKGRRRAVYDEYERIDPPLVFEQVGGDPRSNRTSSINRVSPAFVQRVLDAIPEQEPERRVVELPKPCLAPEFELDSPSGVREALHRLVALDLLGPACGPEEELLEDPPKTRYVVGTLAPKDAGFDPRGGHDPLATDDPLGGAGETGGKGREEGTAERTTVSESLFASSIGFTFAVSAGVDAIRVRMSWGAYERVESEVYYGENGSPRMVWKRSQRGGEPFDLPLDPGPLEVSPPDPEFPEVVLRGVVRPPQEDGSVLVTLFLVNDQVVEKQERLKDRKWVFQPELEVTATEEGAAPFVRRDQEPDFDPDEGGLEAEERAILAMVHRKQAEFAIGHGVGVHATPAGDPWVDDAGWERATSIRTAVLPSYDVPVTETPTDEELAEEFSGFEGFELDMERLAELPREELVTALRRIPETYGRWIEARRVELEASPDLYHHRGAAELALEKAERARDRLSEGVDVLASDDIAFEAFRFANRAMRLQRLRSVYALRRRRGEDIEFDDVEAAEPAAWRTFQLAFLLLNVPTVARLDHERRTNEVASYADLLWFPTGGGKTEAYLGVAAFSIAVRRLQGVVEGYEGDGGVTVIMRYTLRLLTLQQFQRASTLVCAMEYLRLQDNDASGDPWGNEPFRIGLWVGAKATPNATTYAHKWVVQEKDNTKWNAGAGTSSPLQLTNCPWCGSKLGPDDLRVETYERGRGRSFLFCGAKGCDFNQKYSPYEGIPVVTVDEEIYRLLPTILLATVDKFAQMPWRSDVQGLFGRVSGRCERHGWLGTESRCSGVHKAKGSHPASSFHDPPPNGLRPPDLVIQDELHLISGPLGTIVGLYETAIDELCEWEAGGKTVRPKVIASTATTRRAPEQVHKLFCRQVEVFPPSGLEATDNFFSRQRRSGEAKPGRRYLGVCSPGRSRASVLIRIYVAVLAGAQWLWEEVDEDERHLVDPYMTLLGYFNSLRELGGMRRLVDDDVVTRVRKVRRPDRPGMSPRAVYPENVQELTSRIRSSQIPEILDRLDDPFTKSREPGPDGKKPPPPLDAVLATNMVSVGVDVQRLGLMVVSGQPKATAEYIQATSRVGRSTERPGLVITFLNWARPRDLSHYEQFEHYHAVFYRYVEALSVTPFAPRALDRALAGVVASLVRLDDTEFNPNDGAGKVTGAGQFRDIIDEIADRARNSADFEDSAELGARVRSAVAAKLDQWGARAARGERKLGYREPRPADGVTVPLLEAAGNGPWGPFTVPTSMREVEPSVGLVLGDGHEPALPGWEFAPPLADEDEDE